MLLRGWRQELETREGGGRNSRAVVMVKAANPQEQLRSALTAEQLVRWQLTSLTAARDGTVIYEQRTVKERRAEAVKGLQGP